jgi:hypothetical protein
VEAQAPPGALAVEHAGAVAEDARVNGAHRVKDVGGGRDLVSSRRKLAAVATMRPASSHTIWRSGSVIWAWIAASSSLSST